MRQTSRTQRTPAVSASAAAVCLLGAVLAGCGNAADRGHIALDAVSPGDSRAPTKAVPPEDGVELDPLEGGDGPGGGGQGAPPGASGGAPNGTEQGKAGEKGGASQGRDSANLPPGGGTSGGAGGTGGSTPSGGGGAEGGNGGGSGHSGDGASAPRPQEPPGPADPPESADPSEPPRTPEPPKPALPLGPGAPGGLLAGTLERADTDLRWCEKVSLVLLNTGRRPVTSGAVTFGTHIIGGLGIDWATRHSTHALPLPLAPGERRTASYRVCVDAWRVPLGMRLDTRDVTFDWR